MYPNQIRIPVAILLMVAIVAIGLVLNQYFTEASEIFQPKEKKEKKNNENGR